MKKLWCSPILIILIIPSVLGDVQICEIVHPPKPLGLIENCTLACSLRLKDVSLENENVAVCQKNSSIPVICKSKKDCTKYFVAAHCEQIPCFCESEPGSKAFYLLQQPKQVPGLYVCIVSTQWKHPDLPLIPFPWQTLLVVCGILLLLALCLVALRWASPFIRARQVKRVERHSRNADLQGNVDNIRLFSSVPQQENIRFHIRREIPQNVRLSDRSSSVRTSHLGRYTSCQQSEEAPLSPSSLLSEDQPPSYEVAMQSLPAYDQVEDSQDNRDANQMNESRDSQ